MRSFIVGKKPLDKSLETVAPAFNLLPRLYRVRVVSFYKRVLALVQLSF